MPGGIGVFIQYSIRIILDQTGNQVTTFVENGVMRSMMPDVTKPEIDEIVERVDRDHS